MATSPAAPCWGFAAASGRVASCPTHATHASAPRGEHPFAIDPGTGADDSRFRPVPEPRSPKGVGPTIAQLAVEIESREHLTWASQQAANYVLADNDWRGSIASQGVMEPVWLVVTTYEHLDGASPITALVSAEGSSRITANHDLLSIRSADIPLRRQRRHKLRAVPFANSTMPWTVRPNREESIALRCERIPALIHRGVFAAMLPLQRRFPPRSNHSSWRCGTSI